MCTCNNQSLPYEGDSRLTELLEEYKGQKGALIPLLQKTQSIFGYLPEPALRRIAESLKLPLSQVYGVATFYSQFRLKPQGRHVIKVCQGTACHVRGASRILDRLQRELNIKPGETTEDLRFTIEPVACLGACGLAPVMMVDDEAHGRLTPDVIPKILAKYA
ncbi:MAG: NADH-quinone oxidoreductase subunit NuoE [Bacillota bacterium]|nr:MAG: NADH-quinone oxidoreductase subunit NuoE [Bacillota bacterium]